MSLDLLLRPLSAKPVISEKGFGWRLGFFGLYSRIRRGANWSQVRRLSKQPPKVLVLEECLFYWCLISFSGGITLHEASLLLLVLFQFGTASLYGMNPASLIGRGRRLAFLLFAALVLSALVTQMRYHDRVHTQIHWALATFWVVSPAMISRVRWDLLHRLLLWVSLPGLVYSVYWLLRPEEIAWAMEIGFQMYPRAQGLVSNPITNAEGLVVIACWSLARLNGELTPRERGWICAHLCLSVLVVVFSRVRAGLVGFTVLFLLTGYFSPRLRRFSFRVWVSMIVLFGLGILLFGFNFQSIQDRFELIENSLTLIRQNPFFGIGPKRFADNPVEGSRLLLHPHNTILGLAAEAGLLALLAYLAFMVSLALRLWSLRGLLTRGDASMRWVFQMLVGVFVSYWVFGLFDYNFADSELLIFHAFHWGLIAQLSLYLETHNAPPGVAEAAETIKLPEAAEAGRPDRGDSVMGDGVPRS